MSGQPIDPGGIELAERAFELARGDHTEEFVACVAAGVPVHVITDVGDTLPTPAAHHHPEAVAPLLAGHA
jgi:hypothetical protein